MSNIPIQADILANLAQQSILTDFWLAISKEMKDDLSLNQMTILLLMIARFKDDLRSEKVLLEATLEGE